jgi:hypothetical protein
MKDIKYFDDILSELKITMVRSTLTMVLTISVKHQAVL